MIGDGLPQPDAIFVGGNGGEVARLMEACFAALRPGGRLVTNVGTLEMISAKYAVLKRLGGHVDVLLMSLMRSTAAAPSSQASTAREGGSVGASARRVFLHAARTRRCSRPSRPSQ